MVKKVLIISFSLAVVLGAALVMAGNESASGPASGPVQRAVFNVENLSCGACFSKIQAALAPAKGYSGMGANLFRKLVAVDFADPLTPEAIGKTITDLGYPATLDSVAPVEENQTFAYLESLRQGKGGGCCGGGAAVQCPGGGTGCPVDGQPGAGSGKDI